MKPVVSILIAIAGISFLPFAAFSQEQQGCFMLGANGQRIDLSSLCSNSSSGEVALSGIYRAAIKRRNAGIPVIDVTFNGGQTFEMMVDTGASSTVLTEEAANALKLVPDGVILVSTPSDSNVTMSTSRVASIAAGGAIAKNLSVAIAPVLDLGLLGQNFFGNYDVVIKQDVVEFHTR